MGLQGLTGFDCIKRKYNDSIQKISSLWFYCLSYCYRYYLNRIMGLLINRGYYMAAWRYEISLRVSKNISWVSAANEWNIFSTREEKFCISKRPCNVLLYKHQWTTKPFHFNSFFVCSHSCNSDIFTCEDWYQVFVQKITLYFIGVNIINIYLTFCIREGSAMILFVLSRHYIWHKKYSSSWYHVIKMWIYWMCHLKIMTSVGGHFM